MGVAKYVLSKLGIDTMYLPSVYSYGPCQRPELGLLSHRGVDGEEDSRVSVNSPIRASVVLPLMGRGMAPSRIQQLEDLAVEYQINDTGHADPRVG